MLTPAQDVTAEQNKLVPGIQFPSSEVILFTEQLAHPVNKARLELSETSTIFRKTYLGTLSKATIFEIKPTLDISGNNWRKT